MRLLDLLRALDAGRQPDGAPRHRPIRAASARRRTGRGRGRPTGASSTTAPRAILPGSRGTRIGSVLSRGTARSGAASTFPTIKPDAAPGEGVGPFIMNPEGVARLFALDKMAEGPFPEHYEPFENAVRHEPPPREGGRRTRPRACSRATARVRLRQGVPVRRDDVPAHRALPLLDQAHPHRVGAAARAVRGDRRVARCEEGDQERRPREGEIEARRDRGEGARDEADPAPSRSEGARWRRWASPSTGASTGSPSPGYLANTLTPFVGDGNVQTPEFKAFLVNVERA